MYGGSDLAEAAAEHRALRGHRAQGTGARKKRDTGEKSRLKELGGKPGWSWLRVFRRYDDFQAALAQVESEEKAKRHAEDRELVG